MRTLLGNSSRLSLAASLLIAASIPTLAMEDKAARLCILMDSPAYQRLADSVSAELAGIASEATSVQRVTLVDHSSESARARQLLTDEGCDLVLTLGRESSILACQASYANRPVLTFLLPRGSSCAHPALSSIAEIRVKEVVDSAAVALASVAPPRDLALIADSRAIPSAEEAGLCAMKLSTGFVTQCLAVSDDAEALASRLAADGLAAMLLPILPLEGEQLSAFADALVKQKVALYSMRGVRDVENGALAGPATNGEFRPVARRLAIDVQDVIEGRTPGEEPLLLLGAPRPAINLATAEKLGLSLNWSLVAESHLVGSSRTIRPRAIRLEDVLRRANEGNRALLAREREVASAATRVMETRSRLGPKVKGLISLRAIDSEHALALAGNYRRAANWSVVLEQVLYSGDDRSGYHASKDLQRAQELQEDSFRLDVARTASELYFRLLQADVLLQIRQDNLVRTRSHLASSRVRRTLGAAGPAELHRWEAELANARSATLSARADKRSAERGLSRILNEPLDTLWAPSPGTLDELIASMSDPAVREMLETVDGVVALENHLVADGLARSPELQAMDAVLSAQEIEGRSARRSSYLPELKLKGAYSRIFDKDSSGGIEIALGPGGGDLLLDDRSWSVGVTATLPIHTSGKRSARQRRAREDLRRLEYEREGLAEQVEQRIRASVDQMTYSWPNVALSKHAATEAAKTREVVQQAYVHGAASILDLLDAQNAALRAELGQASAVFEFLIDEFERQRAVAYFEHLESRR